MLPLPIMKNRVVSLALRSLVLTLALTFMGMASVCAQGLSVYAEISGLSAIVRNGQLTGYGVEMTEEIMHRVGARTDIVAVPWARAYDQLLFSPNVAVFSTTRTEERDPLFHWVGPFDRVQWVFVTHKNSGITIRSLDDARKLSAIGTYIDDARDQFLVEQGFGNLQRSTSNSINFKKLIRGRLDLVVSTTAGMPITAKRAKVDLDELSIAYVFKEMDLYLAISKQTPPETVRKWQAAFEDMKEDGTFSRIYRKWYPDLEAPMDVRRPWVE